MRTKAIYFSALMLVAVLRLQAQQSFASLDELWRFALENNDGQRIQQMQVEQANAQKRAANAFLFPTVSAGFNGQDNIDISETPVPGELVGQPGETVYMKFGKKYNYSAGINVNYNVLNWQSVYQSRMTKVNLEQQKAGQAYSEQNLKEQIGQLYYATLTAQKAVAIGESDWAVADTLWQLTQKRFEQGLTDAIALNQAQISKNSVAQQLETSRNYQNECLANLKTLLGLEAASTLELTGSLEPETHNDALPQMLPNSRYTDLFRLKESYATAEQKKASAALLPEVSFRGYFGKNQFSDEFSFSLKSENWRPNNYLGMSISVPVFTGWGNRSKVSAAKIEQQIANQTYSDELRKSAIADSLSAQKMVSARQSATLGKETFELSGQNLKLASAKYGQGLISLDGYLKIFDDYLQAESRYLNDLSEFYSYKTIFDARK